MVELYFRMEEIPRTVDREEWKTIYRWTRVKRKELKASNAKKVELIRSGTLPKHIKQDMVDELIYPPLLLGPYMDKAKW